MKEYQNEAWVLGQPIRRKALLLGGIGLVLGATQVFPKAVRWWQLTSPKPVCLDEDGDAISFQTIPCQLPVPLVLGIPYSDPIKAAQELTKRE